MDVLPWAGFALSIAALMIIGRHGIWRGLLAASFVLATFDLTGSRFIDEAIRTLTDPSILLLALAVALIAVLGGVMEAGGLVEEIVKCLHLGRRPLMAAAPALFGMLPMPGGALLSAPLIERGGGEVAAPVKAASNVWFRHVLLLVYPLGALLATTKMARVDLFVAIVYLLPGFLLVIVLGQVLVLRGVAPGRPFPPPRRRRWPFIPLAIILVAPLLDLTLLLAIPGVLHEATLLVAVTVSLLLAIRSGGLRHADIADVWRRMRPWNFALIILTMFLFLHIFSASRAPGLIAGLDVPRAVLLVWVGALLGFATGRVQVPISIVVPIYLSRYGMDAMGPGVFAIMFFSTFVGYMASPVHPCVVVSLEYFRTRLRDFLRVLVLPTFVALALVFAVAAIVPE